jgi:hypothetical protein
MPPSVSQKPGAKRARLSRERKGESERVVDGTLTIGPELLEALVSKGLIPHEAADRARLSMADFKRALELAVLR